MSTASLAGNSISATMLIGISIGIGSGLFLLIFGFLLNMIFNKLSDIEKHKLDVVDFTDGMNSVREDAKLLTRQDNCREIRKGYDGQIKNIDNKMNAYHSDNKEALIRMENLMIKFGEVIDALKICVTKLAANIKCD